MAALYLENITKIFPAVRGTAPVTALKQFSLEVWSGELMVLLGPSGCGKTTLLRIIGGLERVDSGSLQIAGKPVDALPPQKRPVGMAFQHPALLPQLTVAENIALGPKLRAAGSSEAAARVRELAELLDIDHLLRRLPETLSGGQQQRVSLARALANQPEVLLLDEPLANLDPHSRAELRDAIRELQQRLRITTVYVTHDQAEAAAVADRIALMNQGAVVQVGMPAELYVNPRTLFVAKFFGPDGANVLSGVIKDRAFMVQGEGSVLRLPISVAGERNAVCVLRRRGIRSGGTFAGTVRVVQETGWSTTVGLECKGVHLTAELIAPGKFMPGDEFHFSLDPAEFFFFDAGSGERLR